MNHFNTVTRNGNCMYEIDKSQEHRKKYYHYWHRLTIATKSYLIYYKYTETRRKINNVETEKLIKI